MAMREISSGRSAPHVSQAPCITLAKVGERLNITSSKQFFARRRIFEKPSNYFPVLSAACLIPCFNYSSCELKVFSVNSKHDLQDLHDDFFWRPH